MKTLTANNANKVSDRFTEGVSSPPNPPLMGGRVAGNNPQITGTPSGSLMNGGREAGNTAANRPDPLLMDSKPGDYVVKTVRSAALTAALIALGLASKERYDVIIPLLTGTALGCALLAAWERFAVSLFTAQAAREKKIKSRKGLILLFALVKYPLVAFLIHWITRHWNQTQILWFLGGFVLFQAIIVLRALGRALTEGAGK